MTEESIFLHFDSQGRLTQALITDTAPDKDWVQAPADYQMGDVVQLIEGKVTPLNDTQLQLQALTQAQQSAVEQIARFASNVRGQVANYADAYQLAGWNEKARRASAVIAGTASAEDIAIVKIEADKRGKGETPQQLAQLQLSKAQQLASAVSLIDGMESSAIDKVKVAKSVEEVESTLNALYQEAETALATL